MVIKVEENFCSDLPFPVKLDCTKFGQLVLMKIIKIVATNGQTLRVK